MDINYYYEAISRHARVPVSKIKSKSRRQEYVYARHIIRYLLVHGEHLSPKKIENKFGIDHSNVYHSLKVINDLLETDKKFKKDYGEFIDLYSRNSDKKVYISGKVTGIKRDIAESKFNNASKFCIQLGLDPVSPLDIVPSTADWKMAMKICITELLKCDAIYLMSDYEDSPGAMMEYQIAKTLGLQIINIEEYA
jgi:hypothetical protein